MPAEIKAKREPVYHIRGVFKFSYYFDALIVQQLLYGAVDFMGK